MGEARCGYNKSKNVSWFGHYFPEAIIRLQFTHSMRSIFTNAITRAHSAQWRTGHLNEEQKTAVENILKQQSYPHPYILFGPPGTGKTKTLVEAILQLIELSAPNKHILVCATSNSACDEIVQRLISNEMAKNNVFRLFAKSMEEEIADISADVLAVSNLKKTEHYYPSTDALSKYKVPTRSPEGQNAHIFSAAMWRSVCNRCFSQFSHFLLQREGHRVHAYIIRTTDTRPNRSRVLFAHFRRRSRKRHRVTDIDLHCWTVLHKAANTCQFGAGRRSKATGPLDSVRKSRWFGLWFVRFDW